jgi:hypothetical protein
MIVKGIVLIILILGAFAFLGIKIAESIPQKEIKLFFFGLYSITIFTVFNVIISIYFFIKLQDKRGPTGKKGLKGMPGDKGENGMCDSDRSCRYKSLELRLKKYVEDTNQTINESEKNIICSFINKIKENPNNLGNFSLQYMKNINIWLDANPYDRDEAISLKDRLESLTKGTPNMHNMSSSGGEEITQDKLKNADGNAFFSVNSNDLLESNTCSSQ